MSDDETRIQMAIEASIIEMERVAARRDFDVVFRPKASKFKIGDLAPTPIKQVLNGYVAEPLRPGAAARIVTLLTGLGVSP